MSFYLYDIFTLETAHLKQSCASFCPLVFLILVNGTLHYQLTNTEVSEISSSPLLNISGVSKLHYLHTSFLLSTQAPVLLVQFVKLVFSIFRGRLCFPFLQPAILL